MSTASTVARRILVSTLVSGLVAAGGIDAQESARVRARQTLPPDVYRDIVELAEELRPQGVPAEPLFSKALEGMAKRVPPDRLMPAVRSYAGRLGQARGALGGGAPIPLVIAGADAIQRGVPPEVLGSLPADRPRSPVAVLVLAELLESGVPRDRAIDLMRQAMEQRTRDERMLRIPARLRRMIRDGVPPGEAIDRIRRQMQRDRGGSVGPVLPPGDRPIDRLRRIGG